MKKYVVIAIIGIFIAGCQSGSKDNQQQAAPSKDTTVSNTIKPVDTGYVNVNGLKMYYEVYGQGKPVVLIHGSYMTIPLNWAHVIPLLVAKNYKVIVPEMQAHGRTRDIPREFSYEAMADDVSGLLKHLKTDSADIVGFSMGASVAFQFAVRHPEQLRRLVILSGTYAHDGWWPDVEATFATLKPEEFRGSPIQKHYDSLGNDPAKFDDYVKKVISVDLKPYDWTKDVKNIKVPIFMVIGDADGVKYEHALELFKAKGGGKMGDIYGLPKSRLAILPGTTHIGMMQKTDWLIPMITDFLDSDLNPTPPMF